MLPVLIRGGKATSELRRQVLFQKGMALYRQKKNEEAIASLEQSLNGDKRTYESQLPRLWLLHLVYESGGIPKEKRKQDFILRKDLLFDPARTPFAFEDIAPLLDKALVAAYDAGKFAGCRFAEVRGVRSAPGGWPPRRRATCRSAG